ncbi:hypothetical protein Y032_0163g3503 [Ancylostoma ceylanicum]|uniref:Uncharacterized protein n=1 Tax=Ancylostoma ceylanicum TaxID=53326 RepID=A0A016SXS3_9BILA|nr:hypothetical protein Y032_0163g3503 [Ancylostoma ceylanicum]
MEVTTITGYSDEAAFTRSFRTGSFTAFCSVAQAIVPKDSLSNPSLVIIERMLICFSFNEAVMLILSIHPI